MYRINVYYDELLKARDRGHGPPLPPDNNPALLRRQNNSNLIFRFERDSF